MQAQLESSVVPSQFAESEEQATKLLDSKKVISYHDEQGRLFIKMFLIDDSVNVNHWGVANNSIPQNISTVIGKPVVLYKDTGQEPDRHIIKRIPGQHNHPVIAVSAHGEDINHAIANQELYRVGTFIDVQKNAQGQWYGIAEITDQGVKEAINSDPNTPFFVSPSIWNNSQQVPEIVHTASGPVVKMPDDSQMTDWTFMHVALVDRPAYGVKKAFISGKCNGDSNTCVMHLRNASIAENDGKVGCGFCTKQAMNDIASNIEKQGTIELADHANTSHKDSLHNNIGLMSASSDSTEDNKKTTEKKKVVEEEKQEQTSPTQNNEQKSASVIPYEQYALVKEENERLKLQLETTSALLKEGNSKLASVTEDVEKLKQDKLLFELHNIVAKSPTFSRLPVEEQEKQVQKFASQKWTPEQVIEFMAPYDSVIANHFVGSPQQKTAATNDKLVLGGSEAQKTASASSTRFVAGNRELDDIDDYLFREAVV
jgi:hypothetical protein